MLGWDQFAEKNNFRSEYTAAIAAGRNLIGIDLAGLTPAAALHAFLPGEIAVEFDDIRVTGCLMKSIDILSDDGF
jgi:hypothetical protein